jgi:hypothetical protein
VARRTALGVCGVSHMCGIKGSEKQMSSGERRGGPVCTWNIGQALAVRSFAFMAQIYGIQAPLTGNCLITWGVGAAASQHRSPVLFALPQEADDLEVTVCGRGRYRTRARRAACITERSEALWVPSSWEELGDPYLSCRR